MPGTGKTATTLEVIHSLKNQRNHDFKFVHINAMSIKFPLLVYTIICESITGKRLCPSQAAVFLD